MISNVGGLALVRVMDLTMNGSSLRLFCLVFSSVNGFIAAPLAATELTSIALSAGSTGTVAEITMDGQTSFRSMSLARPSRLVVDLAQTQAAHSLKLPDGQGVVQGVRLGHPGTKTLRIVFDLATSVVAFNPQMQATGNKNVLWIQWPGEKSGGDDNESTPRSSRAAAIVPSVATVNEVEPIAAVANSPSAPARLSPADQAGLTSHSGLLLAQKTPSFSSLFNDVSDKAAVDSKDGSERLRPEDVERKSSTAEPMRPIDQAIGSHAAMSPSFHRAKGQHLSAHWSKTLRPLIVAIDPGHGGQDSGAIGPSGRREKDVTLAIGLELARLIRQTPGMQPLLTRTSDVFIPLPARALKARAAKADLFISIHADSTDNHIARGASVYVLSTKGASSQRARWIADKENAADLLGGGPLPQAGTTLANVLLDLAQSGHMKASEDAAAEVLGSLKHVGNTHKSEIERANFVVLRTSDMPAMLVETAFISNPLEEKRLGQPAYRHHIAVAIQDGVIQFFKLQPPPGTLFAAHERAAEHPSSAIAGSQPERSL